MLNGLWGFVLVDKKPKGKALPKVKHVYTHFSLEVTPVIISDQKELDKTTGTFVAKTELQDLALSTLDRKIEEVLRHSLLLGTS